jgi:hypothetical protein
MREMRVDKVAWKRARQTGQWHDHGTKPQDDVQTLPLGRCSPRQPRRATQRLPHALPAPRRLARNDKDIDVLFAGAASLFREQRTMQGTAAPATRPLQPAALTPQMPPRRASAAVPGGPRRGAQANRSRSDDEGQGFSPCGRETCVAHVEPATQVGEQTPSADAERWNWLPVQGHSPTCSLFVLNKTGGKGKGRVIDPAISERVFRPVLPPGGESGRQWPSGVRCLLRFNIAVRRSDHARPPIAPKREGRNPCVS